MANDKTEIEGVDLSFTHFEDENDFLVTEHTEEVENGLMRTLSAA